MAVELLHELADIPPVLAIPDNSALWLGVLTAAMVGLLVLAAFGWRLWEKRRRLHWREEALRHLQALKLDEPKKAAYALTKLGYCLKSPPTEEAYAHMVEALEPYKYALSVAQKFDDEALAAINRFRKGLL